MHEKFCMQSYAILIETLTRGHLIYIEYWLWRFAVQSTCCLNICQLSTYRCVKVLEPNRFAMKDLKFTLLPTDCRHHCSSKEEVELCWKREAGSSKQIKCRGMNFKHNCFAAFCIFDTVFQKQADSLCKMLNTLSLFMLYDVNSWKFVNSN